MLWGRQGSVATCVPLSTGPLTSIERREEGNAFAKHLADHHPDRKGDYRSFDFKVMKTFQKPLYRQGWEAVKIHGCKATIIMNSRSEWHQPVTEWW